MNILRPFPLIIVAAIVTAPVALAQAPTPGDSSTAADSSPSADASASTDGAPSSSSTPRRAAGAESNEIVEDEIVVTAGRREQRQSELVRTTTVIDSTDLRVDFAKSSNVGDVLGRMIPGYGAPTYIDLIRNQTLRGREPQYLFDGVPLVYNGGAGFSESPLVKFEPAAVDRVEVLYGPTSTYGAGATGGVIQMLTRDAAGESFRLELSQQATTFTEASSPFGDEALSYKTAALASGRLGNFDYLLSGSFDEQNGVFDGGGDIANPVYYGFTEDTSYFGKFGYELTPSQRIEGFYSFVERDLDGRVFETILRDDGFATGQESGNQLAFNYGSANEPIDEKSLLSVRYTHANVAGGQLELQYYEREDEIIGAWIDLRGLPLPPVFPNNYQKTQLDGSEGVRSQYTRAFGDRLNVQIGFDWEDQTRASRALVFDVGPDFDIDRDVSTPIRDDLFLYPFDLQRVGYFAQLDFQATDRLVVSGGIRYEDVEF
ncbi:MAG: TonB-dependent receptor plug domain-containing protein, partial [Acidobacteriota bacterium]